MVWNRRVGDDSSVGWMVFVCERTFTRRYRQTTSNSYLATLIISSWSLISSLSTYLRPPLCQKSLRAWPENSSPLASHEFAPIKSPTTPSHRHEGNPSSLECYSVKKVVLGEMHSGCADLSVLEMLEAYKRILLNTRCWRRKRYDFAGWRRWKASVETNVILIVNSGRQQSTWDYQWGRRKSSKRVTGGIAQI